jgi:TctA family transporter
MRKIQLRNRMMRRGCVSRGDPMTFIQRPISATMLGLALVLIAFLILPAVRKGFC